MTFRGMPLRMLLCVCAVCVVTGARADAKSYREAIDELMTQVRAEGLVQGWRQRLENQAVELVDDVLQGRSESELTPIQRGAIDKFSQKARGAVDSTLAWSNLHNEVAKVYMQHFTEAEVRELLAFYRSPIGRKWVGRMPQVYTGIDQLIQARVQASIPEFKRLGRELRSDYAGSALQPQPAVPTPPVPAIQPEPVPAPQSVPFINPKTGRP